MATALYLVLEPATGRIVLSSAGHLPPLYLEGPETRYVDVRAALSPPLGLTVQTRRQMAFQLPDGAALLLFTDGLVERTHNIDEGLDQLCAAAGAAPTGSLDELCEHVLLTLAPTSRYRDDVALLALRRG
jgi:serine phosphatase RsbU (regulator of sigma subunit)